VGFANGVVTRGGRKPANLDEFKQLEQVADLRRINSPEPMDSADLLILPGSTHVAEDLAWLVSTGLAEAALEHARRGRRCSASAAGCRCSANRLRISQASMDWRTGWAWSRSGRHSTQRSAPSAQQLRAAGAELLVSTAA